MQDVHNPTGINADRFARVQQQRRAMMAPALTLQLLLAPHQESRANNSEPSKCAHIPTLWR
jgi:hypothetical protein